MDVCLMVGLMVGWMSDGWMKVGWMVVGWMFDG